MSFNILKLVFFFLCLTFLVNSKTNEVIELQVYHRNTILRRLSDKTLTQASSNIDDDDDYRDYYDYSQYNGMRGRVVPDTSEEYRGVYFTRVVMGEPFLQEFFLAVDTGSAFTWLQCQPCDKCFQQIDPIFNKSKSFVYRTVYCDEEYCKIAGKVAMCDAETNRCTYQVSYGDRSTTKGDVVVDTMTFENSNVSIYHFVHGCGYNNQGLFGYSAGILGLGPDSSSLPYQIQVDGFSYCFSDPKNEEGSTLSFGSNLLLNRPSSVSIPMMMIEDRQHYYIDMTGISIGGKMLPLPQSTFLYNKYDSTGVIVDSGTIVTFFPEKAFGVIVNEFATRMNWTREPSISVLEACFTGQSVNIPTMSFHFRNGKMLEFPSDRFVFTQSNFICLEFLTSPSSMRKVTIIGSLLQQGMRLTFELSRSLLEFTPDQC